MKLSQEEIYEKHKKNTKRKNIGVLSVMLGLIIFGVGHKFFDLDMFFFIFLAIGFVLFFIGAIFYRCPNCNKFLNVRQGSITKCPYCSVKLEKENDYYYD